MKRRSFVKFGSLLAGSSLIPIKAYSLERDIQKETVEKHIDFIYDGTELSPTEYSELLLRLVEEGKVKPDDYSNGGVVEELEDSFAKQLGK